MHSCFQCGCDCYCHGDIDDCQVETEEYAYEHCVGCGGDNCGRDDFDFPTDCLRYSPEVETLIKAR